MALSEEEQATLAALQKKAEEKDDDSDYDVEWWTEDESGKRQGGRVPWSTGKKMYGSFFPDLFGEKPEEQNPPGGSTKPPKRPSEKYFGRGSGTD